MKTALVAALSGAFLFASAQFASAQDKPTDPQIAHIAYTAGVIDIEAAKLAISKSKNTEVVEFAQSMVKDHEAVNVQALDLVKKLNVTSEDNPPARRSPRRRTRSAPNSASSTAPRSTKPTSTTRSPITSRSTRRWRRCSSRRLGMPSSRACWKRA